MEEVRPKEKPRKWLGFGARHFHNLGPHLFFPAVVAGGGEDDLVVLRQDEARRAVAALGALVAHLEFGEDPARIGGPALFLEDQCPVGRMDDPVVEFLEGVGRDEDRLRLGTPDLAAASKLVADEHQRRAPSLGNRGAGQRRCGGHRQATHHHRPSVEHCDALLVEPLHEANMSEALVAAKARKGGLTVL